MSKNSIYIKLVQRFLPSPFTIAILLTLATMLLALVLTSPKADDGNIYFVEILGFWEKGFWELLTFSMQMVLILVLGHTLALTPLFKQVIESAATKCTSTAKAALIVSFTSIAVSFLNWGLCLIVGAIFARKVAEINTRNGNPINYPLIAAAGYSGMMTWHGGFSGSAPLSVAAEGHFLQNITGLISIDQTLLSSMNLTASIAVLILIPGFLFILAKSVKPTPLDLAFQENKAGLNLIKITGADKLDHSRILSMGLGLMIVAYAVYKAFVFAGDTGLGFVNLNYVNFCLLGLSILFHGSFANFLAASEEAVRGATGIIIQFPFYAGIMGIMKYSGVVNILSDHFVNISNATTLPIFTFISAGIVNIFVPSGGGQWIVQGPIVTQAANVLGVPLAKIIMALSYGDQLTNMLQPFWALPLLGITQLKAKDILPYSFIIMLAGATIFIAILLLF
ncbi:MAG: TIGR00366 family protein [Bacteroidota bacterium]